MLYFLFHNIEEYFNAIHAKFGNFPLNMRVKINIDMRSGIRKVGKWGIESLKMSEMNSYTTGGFTCIPVVYPIYKFKTHFSNI